MSQDLLPIHTHEYRQPCRRATVTCGPEEKSTFGVVCFLTRDEHRRDGLEVALRRKQHDLYLRMLDCPLSELSDLGWERYRLAEIEWFPIPQGLRLPVQ